ncbi:hypothetical protein [Bradyrhizobium sp. BWA-3-5]|uniref:hypothetical protein n=1 Tax=Bradyrhizobium sp. BWA-3-5 TaxID=3080013 RepID=UPI00293E75C8|nr:hypothetical protein [Bradyrhizobium sp. BWA-3-5]WOH64012.1 hypothetical protein RX331_25750 [Bradyrhizobium sp. BWA-3-5]
MAKVRDVLTLNPDKAGQEPLGLFGRLSGVGHALNQAALPSEDRLPGPHMPLDHLKRGFTVAHA